jgi:AcrR family transcriptional regulator
MTSKRQTTEVRRNQIVLAARELIARYGSEHVTIRRIAKHVGISEAAIYRHFKSKRDILSVLADYMDEHLVGEIKQAYLEAKTSSLDIIDETLRNHISNIEQRWGISFQVIAEIISLGDKKLNLKMYEVVEDYIFQLSELLKRGIQSGEIRPETDPSTAAIMLFGIIQSLVNIWALNNFGFNLVERYEPLWKMFRDSIAVKTTEPMLSRR